MVSDLSVDRISNALEGKNIDLVITGSIAATESVRFSRSLRRIGANVFPWLTQGALQFITPTALEWACNNPVTTDFSGLNSHLATRDAVVVAPATADFIAKLAHGICDNAALAVTISYLGSGKPVYLLANMHDSLYQAPQTQQNLQIVSQYCTLLTPRIEEGKQKFPDSNQLADQIAHLINQEEAKSQDTVITFGTTRGYIDDVRYISNYSSGKLGSLICDELYRHGVKTTAIIGPCNFSPLNATKIIRIETNEQMRSALDANAHQNTNGIFAASILDFIPDQKISGKIRSSEKYLDVHCVPTEKLIARYQFNGKKIGFKLEPLFDLQTAQQLAKKYFSNYELSHFILNALPDVSSEKHRAYAFDKSDLTFSPTQIDSKQKLAQYLAQKIIR